MYPKGSKYHSGIYLIGYFGGLSMYHDDTWTLWASCLWRTARPFSLLGGRMPFTCWFPSVSLSPWHVQPDRVVVVSL